MIKKWYYYCKGKKIYVDKSEVVFEHGRYPLVVCDKCCNIPVTHLVTKEEK